MAPRDIDQILQRKERWGTNRPVTELYSAVERLEHEWLEKQEQAAAFTDFIPMRLVTLIEVFVREVIRELVDYGPPYLDRAENWREGQKSTLFLLLTYRGRGYLLETWWLTQFR